MGVISLSSASVQEKGPVCPDDLNKSDYALFIYILQSYRQTIKVNATVFVVMKITKNLHSYNPLGEMKKLSYCSGRKSRQEDLWILIKYFIQNSLFGMFTWQQQFTIMTKITQIMKYSVLHTVLDNYSSDLVIA